jgi:hypothetical protein
VLAALAAFYGADHFRPASAMTMLGRALIYQKSFDEGVPLLERALAIQERVNARRRRPLPGRTFGRPVAA